MQGRTSIPARKASLGLAVILAGFTLAGCSAGTTSTGGATQPPAATTPAVPPATQTNDVCAGATSWKNAAAKEGQTALIEGPVRSAVYTTGTNGKPTFLNVGLDYPNSNRFTVVIWGDDRSSFSRAPEAMYDGETICVRGRVQEYNGIPQIQVSSPGQITVAD